MGREGARLKSTVQAPLDWLDRARSSVIAIVARAGLLPLVARRDARVKTRAAFAIGLALVSTIVCPALALAISPAIFGVPHIAASVRYLLLRQGLSRRFLIATAALAVAMMTLRILEQYGAAVTTFARAEIVLAAAWALIAATAAARSSRSAKRLAIACAVIVIGGAIAFAHPLTARIAFAHVHNLGVVALWLVGFRRGRLPAWTLALLAFGIVLLISGATLGATRALGGTSALGVDLFEVGRWLVPGAAAGIALPLVLAHAFTDSVHYAFWLGVIPDETLEHQGSLSFRMTLRGLTRDFGKLGLAAIALAALLVLGASAIDGAGTRSAYFAIAGFHGYIEGVMLVFLMVRGRPMERQVEI